MNSSKKIKVLWTLRNLELGGCETFCLLMLPVLKQYFDISLLLTSVDEKGEGALYNQAVESGINVLKFDMHGKLNRKRIKEGAKFLSDFAPDIVHTHSFANNFAVRSAAILAKVPVIITHYHTMPNKRFDEKLYQAEKILLPATDSSLFVSKASLTEYRKLIGNDFTEKYSNTFQVIHDALDIKKLRDEADKFPPEKLKGQYSIPSDSPIIGTIARLHPVKNLETLIKTAKLLKKDYPSIKCFIVGDGNIEYKSKLEKLTEELYLKDNIVFAGYQRNVGAYFKMFDVALLTSQYEGLPRSVIESYAVGTPVVASKIPGMDEILENGKLGFLANYDNQQEFSQYVKILLDNKDKRAEFSNNCKIHSEKFDINFYCEKLCELYDNLLANQKKSVLNARKTIRMKFMFGLNI